MTCLDAAIKSFREGFMRARQYGLRPLETEKKRFMRTISVALDAIAKRILEELVDGPRGIDSIAEAVSGGATRLISPRLVWLEGLGMVENTGAGNFSITALGVRFLGILR